MELMQASRQWASRPSDERFLNLPDMAEHFRKIRQESVGTIGATSKLQLVPNDDNKGLMIDIKGTRLGDDPWTASHWSFGQIATLADAPAGYMRKLASPIAADCINYGLRFIRSVEDVGLLLHEQPNDEGGFSRVLRAATGPKYGRIWNNDIITGLVKAFGDGINGQWRVPGEFGKKVDVTKENTTLYAGDRDMFIFLADEENRIEVPNRRDGKSGSLARGFFTSNSEVGSSTFYFGSFLFDFACRNRIVWGAQDLQEIKIRHTAGAPDRFLRELEPAIRTYASQSSASIVHAVQEAKRSKIGDESDVTEFLAKRFGTRMGELINKTHQLEEGRPVETLWDATTAVTAYARGIEYQDERVTLERKGGELLTLAVGKK